jgi:hypothetical protein
VICSKTPLRRTEILLRINLEIKGILRLRALETLKKTWSRGRLTG